MARRCFGCPNEARTYLIEAGTLTARDAEMTFSIGRLSLLLVPDPLTEPVRRRTFTPPRRTP
jgi:hypothetical protein